MKALGINMGCTHIYKGCLYSDDILKTYKRVLWICKYCRDIKKDTQASESVSQTFEMTVGRMKEVLETGCLYKTFEGA